MLLVLIHVFYYLGKFVYHRYKDGMSSNNDDEPYPDVGASTRKKFVDNDEESKSIIKFVPPAYIQRYQAVVDVLIDSRYRGKLKKIVDFGCSELGFCIYLKYLAGIEEVLFVDIDKNTLEMYKERAKPLIVDYLHRRSSPLTMQVLEGSVTQHDESLENCDAVVCIELIEHLYPETLMDLPYNIFGFIKPKVAVITTPNADFNVLFKNMVGFRHPDHKFEWTRRQFQDWAHNIVSRYSDYEVTFHGICNGPSGTENLGACSQMAVFHKICDSKLEKVPSIQGLFKPIEVYEYPHEIDNRSDEQKILDDAQYYIRKFAYAIDGCEEEISLQTILNIMKNYCISLNELKEILENANWNIIERDGELYVLIPPPSRFSDYSFVDDDFSEDDFLDNEIPPGYDDWGNDEPGPPNNYKNESEIVSVVDEDDWDNEPHFIASSTEIANSDANNINFDAETADSTISICADDVCLDDIDTENRSSEFVNSTVDESILISSFSETKGSENSENARNSQIKAQTLNDESTPFSRSSLQLVEYNKLENLENDSVGVAMNNATSICSMFLEPSNISKDIHLEDVTDPHLESIILSPSIENGTKKLKLSNNLLNFNTYENSFEEPKYTSSPRVLTTLNCNKRKIAKHKSDCYDISSSSSSNLCTDDTSDLLEETKYEFDEQSLNFSESVNNLSCKYSTEQSGSEILERVRHCTGAIPKNLSGKILDAKTDTQKEIKLETISPDTPEGPPNSWSPEIMDSGYPNSNSPPDLSPEYDLSSIAHDHIPDSESPSIADGPRIGLFEPAEVENRDLANNNLDDEGNNMEAEENHQINDFRPLMNALENDLENENDIYVVRNGFPIWLLRILQRFDPDGVGINLPILQRANENFGI